MTPDFHEALRSAHYWAVVGATIVAAHAGEMISEITVAMTRAQSAPVAAWAPDSLFALAGAYLLLRLRT